jgi:four helix bundle protein
MERVDFKIKEEDKNNVIKRTYKFALRTLYIAQKLPNNPVTNKVIGQLVGSGTSMGSNTEEASAGFNKNDFTFKMSIASKESREVNYWLRLLRDSGLIKDKSFYDEVVDAIDESDQLKRILTKIVKTSQKNEKSKHFLSKPES